MDVLLLKYHYPYHYPSLVKGIVLFICIILVAQMTESMPSACNAASSSACQIDQWVIATTGFGLYRPFFILLQIVAIVCFFWGMLDCFVGPTIALYRLDSACTKRDQLADDTLKETFFDTYWQPLLLDLATFGRRSAI